MKTTDALKNALDKYQDELALVREKIKELDDVYVRAGAVMDNKDFLVACSKQLDELRKLEYEADFRVRFTKWVLE